MHDEFPVESKGAEPRSVSRGAFLRDVFACSLGAYGGPEAHMGVFIDQMVVKRGYLTEEELIELIALCGVLPGPTSTQTIIAIGYKKGGPWLAFWTMLAWALPVLVAMTLLSFLYVFLGARNLSADFLRYVGPMAVGFIGVAAWRINRKVVTNRMTALLAVFGMAATYFSRSPWVFPALLLVGGAVSVIASKERDIWNRTTISPPWRFLAWFVALALGSLGLAAATNHRIVDLFEHFYRYGYLVFGGGQVLVPVMREELVELNRYMTDAEFLTGYGLVQGLPGPMFSFAAYAGGMAARGGSVATQLLGAAAGGVGIFLPGLLLIYFVYPVWENVKKIRAIKISLAGINAVAGGMIAAAAVTLFQTNPATTGSWIATGATLVLLATKKLPAPLIVLAALLAGALV